MEHPPLWSSPEDETWSEQTERVARAQARFDQIQVDYPPQTGVVAILDEVRLAARFRTPGAPCGGAMLVAPHGTGKTVAVKQLISHASQAATEGQVPVLYVEIATQGTSDSVPSSILHALKVARPDVGTERARWLRATAELQRAGVELVVFDEFNRASRRHTMSRAIATSIRERIMDAGIAPVAFVGSEDAGTVLWQVPELVERLEGDVTLAPLDWLVAGEREIFLSFVDDLDSAIAADGLLADKSDLANEATAQKLWLVTQGRIRRIAKLIRHAMTCALRDGRALIYHQDLLDAAQIVCVDRKFYPRNPFCEEIA